MILILKLNKCLDGSKMSDHKTMTVCKSYEDMINHIKLHNKRVGSVVPNPDFEATRFFSPQWKINGSELYYVAANKQKLAHCNQRTKEYKIYHY